MDRGRLGFLQGGRGLAWDCLESIGEGGGALAALVVVATGGGCGAALDVVARGGCGARLERKRAIELGALGTPGLGVSLLAGRSLMSGASLEGGGDAVCRGSDFALGRSWVSWEGASQTLKTAPSLGSMRLGIASQSNPSRSFGLPE